MAYRQVLDQRYPEADAFVGQAEVGIVEVKGLPEQLLPADLAGTIAQRLIEAVPNYGGKLMRVRIWVDTEPTWYTVFKIEVTLHASPFAFAALLPVLLLLGLVAIIGWEVKTIDWGKAAAPLGLGLGVLLVALVLLGGIGRRSSG